MGAASFPIRKGRFAACKVLRIPKIIVIIRLMKLGFSEAVPNVEALSRFVVAMTA